jgi:hypothetical protein
LKQEKHVAALDDVAGADGHALPGDDRRPSHDRSVAALKIFEGDRVSEVKTGVFARDGRMVDTNLAAFSATENDCVSGAQVENDRAFFPKGR